MATHFWKVSATYKNAEFYRSGFQSQRQDQGRHMVDESIFFLFAAAANHWDELAQEISKSPETILK